MYQRGMTARLGLPSSVRSPRERGTFLLTLDYHSEVAGLRRARCRHKEMSKKYSLNRCHEISHINYGALYVRMYYELRFIYLPCYNSYILLEFDTVADLCKE